MMISPESYYEMNLQGKTAEQIMSSIRGLKNEIGHLKNVMEHPDYNSKEDMCPQESTQLWCAREYLKRAKNVFTEAGGVYEPSQAEQKAIMFDERISKIDRIVFIIGSFFGGYETRTIFMNDGNLKISVKHSIETDPDKITEDSFSLYNKEDFLSELRLLHIGEWRHTYSLARFGETVLDGTQWELEIHYSDGSKSFKCYGSNSYPSNFIEFCELLNLDG